MYTHRCCEAPKTVVKNRRNHKTGREEYQVECRGTIEMVNELNGRPKKISCGQRGRTWEPTIRAAYVMYQCAAADLICYRQDLREELESKKVAAA